MKKIFVNPSNAKRPDDNKGVYAKTIEEIEKNNVCPFCFNNLSKYHKKPIIKENDGWLLTENMYPYKGTKIHLLLIHKRHITSIEEVSSKDWSLLQEIITFSIKEFNIKGGSFFIRFGNSTVTGATVSHLHAQLVVRDLEKKDPILARLG